MANRSFHPHQSALSENMEHGGDGGGGVVELGADERGDLGEGAVAVGPEAGGDQGHIPAGVVEAGAGALGDVVVGGGAPEAAAGDGAAGGVAEGCVCSVRSMAALSSPCPVSMAHAVSHLASMSLEVRRPLIQYPCQMM